MVTDSCQVPVGVLVGHVADWWRKLTFIKLETTRSGIIFTWPAISYFVMKSRNWPNLNDSTFGHVKLFDEVIYTGDKWKGDIRNILVVI